MHSAVKIKLFTSFLLALFLGLQGASLAHATDIPTLQWERGRQQVITLGGNTADKLWTINLAGQGKTLSFSRSSVNKAGFIVYSVEIPANFAVGNYEVQVSGPAEAQTTTAYVKILEQVSYDPLTDPKGVGVIAVIAFTLLSFFSGSKAESDQSSDDEASSLEGLDVPYQGIEIVRRGPLDQARFMKSRFSKKLDELRHLWVLEISPRSPLISRVLADGTYTQSLFGPLSLLLPIAGIALGIEIGQVNDLTHSLLPTTVGLVIAVVFIGILDSLAGIAAFLSFLFVVIAHGKIHHAIDVRSLLGLSVLWFTPSLAAGMTRPLRRKQEDWDWWERLCDVLISTLVSGWAIKGMTLALDGFSHQKTALAEHSTLMAVFGAAGVLVRYLIEEMATRLAPIRVEYLTPPRIKEQYFDSFVVTLFIRTVLYLFFMFGFFGLCWQLFVATALLILMPVLKRGSHRLPNITWLWQIIPGGVPSIVFMSLLGFAFTHWVNSLPLVSADKTKTILILTTIPGLVMGLLKLFGRGPKSGDVRWYRRPSFKYFYRLTGPLMLTLAVLITIGVIA